MFMQIAFRVISRARIARRRRHLVHGELLFAATGRVLNFAAGFRAFRIIF